MARRHRALLPLPPPVTTAPLGSVLKQPLSCVLSVGIVSSFVLILALRLGDSMRDTVHPAISAN